MTKWEYGLAHYDGDLIEADGNYMNDMEGAGRKSIHAFLEEAGEKGWELCTFLPGNTDKPHEMCVLFKRPSLK
jgi:hypothetical protein